ncbi:MAG: HD domain-containing protein [Patescibacteria group bacterium]
MNTSPSLQSLFEFLRLMSKFQSIERKLYVVGLERRENDVEHSFLLAISAWYIISSEQLSLDINKAIKYALVHDLVEIYAGDVSFYDKKSLRERKKEREALSLLKLEKDFSKWQEFSGLVHAYEEKGDPESRFVYALDKLLPIVNNYLDNGKTWKKDKITLEQVIEYKQDKVALSPDIKIYFDELISILKDKEVDFFPTD